MDSGMAYDLAKLHIEELLREAERERLAKQAVSSRHAGPIDSVGYRERIARLLSGFPPLGPVGPRPAGA